MKIRRLLLVLLGFGVCGIGAAQAEGRAQDAASKLSPPQEAAQSDSFFQWHTTNIQFLRGANHKVDGEERTIMTLEHANGFKYGDFFMFVDRIWPDEGKAFYYFEPTLRLSFSKMTGYDFSYGIIKDVLIAGQLEKPKSKSWHKLGGIAVDFKVPGFKFLKTHLFYRDDPDLSGATHQATVVWNRPFEVAGLKFLTEGFADFAGSEGNRVPHELIVPRLLMDLGHAMGGDENKLWAGVEYSYWHNKFGLDGRTESAPQLQVKYIF